MAVHASDVASVTDAAGVVRVSPVLVRLAQAEVERHHREGTEAPLGIIKIAQARAVHDIAIISDVATATVGSKRTSR